MQEIDGKLQELSLQKLRLTDEEVLHQQHSEEERGSTRQCLRICAEVAKHMDQLHLSTLGPVRPNTGQAVISVLGNSLSARHLHEVNSRLESLAGANNKTEEGTEEKRIREEEDCIE